MKKLFFFVVLGLGLICGCDKITTEPAQDNKPVAPETPTYGQSEKADPQLPNMKPHWK